VSDRRRTDIRCQMTDDRYQMTEDPPSLSELWRGKRRTEDGCRRTDVGASVYALRAAPDTSPFGYDPTIGCPSSDGGDQKAEGGPFT